MEHPFIYKKFETRESLDRSLLDTLGALFRGATEAEPYAVMLSGGSTPEVLYNRIAQSDIHAGSGLYLLISDERIVPSGSPDANKSIVEPMAKAIGLPEERLILVDHELPVEKAAAAYSNDLTELNAKGISRRAAILGIGADGHTASLFSVDAAKTAHTTLAEPVGEHAGFRRVTATPEEILTYQRLIFFAGGEKKKDILAEIYRDPQAYPAGVIATRHGHAELWTDVDVPGAGEPGSGGGNHGAGTTGSESADHGAGTGGSGGSNHVAGGAG